MTINEAITIIDEQKPNTFVQLAKVRWLSTIDWQIKRTIIDTHELADGESESEFTGYDENTDLNTALLAPAPFDDLYIHWLRSQIDYAYEEYKKFNNSNAMFKTLYGEYENWYNRTHMPKPKKYTYF